MQNLHFHIISMFLQEKKIQYFHLNFQKKFPENFAIEVYWISVKFVFQFSLCFCKKISLILCNCFCLCLFNSKFFLLTEFHCSWTLWLAWFLVSTEPSREKNRYPLRLLLLEETLPTEATALVFTRQTFDRLCKAKIQAKLMESILLE